jgi:hypothetical protein
MTYRDPNYLEWVRSLPCRVCGNWPSEAHHIRGVGHLGGMGLKATDLAVMPLCSRHHRALHDQGTNRERQFEWAYKTLRMAARKGLFGPLHDDLDSTHITLQGERYETLWRLWSERLERAVHECRGRGEGVPGGGDPAGGGS